MSQSDGQPRASVSEQLEAVVQRLESGELTHDAAAELAQSAATLAADAASQLDSVASLAARDDVAQSSLL